MFQIQQITDNTYIFPDETKNPYMIYGLVDPRNNKLRYIGKTVTGMSRYSRHLSKPSLNEGNTKKNNWIKSLLKRGLKPNFAILIAFNNNFSREQNNRILYRLEQSFITFYNQIYPNELLNHTDGGLGTTGYKHTEESRKKMSISAKARGLNYRKPKLVENKIINNVEYRFSTCCNDWIPLNLMCKPKSYSRQCKKCFNKNRKSRAKCRK